jgi:sugar transferase (PEP-CTERM/EpsH1 system associated)
LKPVDRSVLEIMSSRKLRILYLVLEMDLGGLQRMINLLVKRLDKNAFEPYIVCLDRGGIFYEQTASVCTGAFILDRQPGPFDRRLFSKLYSIIRDSKIDIIQSNNGCSSYAVLAGKLAGVKRIIHTDHGRLVPDRRSARLEDRFSSYMMDRYIGVSEELTEYLASTVEIPRKKLMTIINGVDTDIFRPAETEQRITAKQALGFSEADNIIGTVCRLDPIKNLEFMISCMPAIVRQIPDAKLAIVGDGPAKYALMQLAHEMQIDTAVYFLGQREGIENIVPAFDVYACTSLSEGTSMTILEAMSCGLPIVASAVGGNVRLVDSTNGILFPPGQENAFVDGIVHLLSDKHDRVDKGMQSRLRVDKYFSIAQMVRQYEALYASLCEVS